MKLKFVVLFMLLVNISSAGDYLEPEDNQFSGLVLSQYHQTVIDVFREVYRDDILLRAIIFPHFEPVYTVAVKKGKNRFSIITLSPKKPIFQQVYKEDSSPDKKKIQNEKIVLNRCEVPMSSVTADRLAYVWEKMLLDTRYQKANFGLLRIGGMSYYFSMTIESALKKGIAGKIQTPEPNTNPAKLSSIAEYMRYYCTYKIKSNLENIEALLDDLEKSFKKNN